MPWLWKWIKYRLTTLACLQLFLYIFRIFMGRRNCEEKHVLAWKVDSFLGCIRQSVARGSREEIPLCQYVARHISSSLSNAGLPSSKETLGIVKLVWRKTMKMIKGLEHLEYKERL